VSEGEHERLRRALQRLLEGHGEALGVIDRALEDLEASAEESLAEVQDILTGAHEDAQSILGGEEGQA